MITKLHKIDAKGNLYDQANSSEKYSLQPEKNNNKHDVLIL